MQTRQQMNLKNGTSSQQDPDIDDEQKEHKDYNAEDSQKPLNEAISFPIEELSINSCKFVHENKVGKALKN